MNAKLDLGGNRVGPVPRHPPLPPLFGAGGLGADRVGGGGGGGGVGGGKEGVGLFGEGAGGGRVGVGSATDP